MNEKPYKLFKNKNFEIVYCITDDTLTTMYITLNINKGNWRMVSIPLQDFLERFAYIKDLTEAEMFVELL